MMEAGIELKEFLNFLSTACKVNVSEDSEEMKNLNDNLNELTSNLLLQRLFDDAEKERSIGLIRKNVDCRVNVDHFNEIVDLLKNKLSELLNEGIFDSILTYITSRKMCANASKFCSSSGIDNEPKTSHPSKKKREKKKRISESKKNQSKIEVEVEIQVYEEDKGLKKVYKCPQSLLVSNMPYFSEINKGRKLEEMDIMVHCEIATFEWLMKWVKKNSANPTLPDIPPKLDFKNVISIMSLASFLKMKPLFQDCIHFCKYNMNDVIKFTPNLSCLKDTVLKKLAELFDNIEIQNLRDEEDRIKSRLFSKLVRSLRDTETERKRGHFASLACLYSCLSCGKLVNRFTAPYVPCQVQNITIKSDGDVVFKHVRDSSWNIDDHVKKVWMQCKNWSSAYWKLWSQCHFLYCDICHTMYAVAFSDCCPYHPQPAQFHSGEQFPTSSSPIGRYPCCGSKAIRYETVKIRSGCKSRSHSPKLLTDDDECIRAIVDRFPELIKVEKAENSVATIAENFDDMANLDILLRNAVSTGKNEKNANQGLLYGPVFESHLKIIKKYKSVNSWVCKDDCSNAHNLDNRAEDFNVESAGESENSDISSFDFSTAVANNEPEIAETTAHIESELNTPQNELKPSWTARYPNRFYNEDNQRDYEEVAFQAISEALIQHNDRLKCGSRDVYSENSFPPGGSYAKIESEWKEARLKILGCKFNKP